MTGALVDEDFTLGPYAVKEVDRDWDSGSGVSVFSFAADKTESRSARSSHACSWGWMLYMPPSED